MARIALGITIALIIVSCVFGYLTHTKVTDLTDSVTKLTSDLATANQATAKAKADLKSSQDELAKTKTEAEQAKTQLASAQSDLEASKAQVDSITKERDDLKAKITQMTPSSAGPIATTGPTQADMDALNKKLTDSQAAVAELTTLKETLTNKAKDADARADNLEQIVKHYQDHALKNGLQGEVLAYNPGWNFVVLSIGDRQGAVANAEMILQRGGSQIGKVRITSVEPSTSVADIVPGSLERGVKVQPGDQVIFTGQ